MNIHERITNILWRLQFTHTAARHRGTVGLSSLAALTQGVSSPTSAD